VALNWCIAQDSLPIPGASSLRNVKDSIECLSWSLSRAEVEELGAVADRAPRAMVQNIFQTA
jgi:aryl-alcohol dehydrogenase-like predicted oxidoreductase